MTPRPRSFYSPWVLWMVWVIWLPFLLPGIIQLVQPPVSTASVLAMVLMAAFVSIYCFFSFRTALTLSGRRDGEGPALPTFIVLVMLILSVAVEMLGRPINLGTTSLYIYTAAYAGSVFRIPRGIITNAVVLGISVALGFSLGVAFSETLPVLFVLPVVTFMTMSWTRSIVVGRKLHEAQDEIARLAAAGERLRIARDLHDLLGQKLSYIALKSELARHLVAAEPERAQAEIAEVESTVRSTLQEVREAVAGYRKPDLSRELRSAAEVLSAAGIQLSTACDPRVVARLPSTTNEALAWAVREGVTNVIRHSRAKACGISLEERDTWIVLEIVDDGSGGAPANQVSPGKGNGLHGLQERLAAIGGASEARGRTAGGFALTVTVPTGGMQ